MTIKFWSTPLIALAVGIPALPATAQVFTFSGTRENVNPLAPPGTGRCAPALFNTVSIAPGALSSTGTSNIESFTSTQSHCIASAPPTAISGGLFTYTFRGGDTVTGTYTGNALATATPGSFASTENLVVTGGTGRFTGATGTITSAGTLVLANGNGNFTGNVNGSLANLGTNATGSFAVAQGLGTSASGANSTAVGTLSLASGLNSLAAGSFADATGEGAVALGRNAFASALTSTALGQEATATGIASSALGHNANATGLGATAVGVRAQSTGIGSTSVGRLSGATADNATALGASASATFAGSTAIGTGAATTAANQVALGGTGSAVRVGDIGASTAAQTAASVGVATVDGNGVLGRNTTLLPALSTLQGQTTTLFDLAEVNRRDIRKANAGVAMAMAMESPTLPSGANFAVAGGLGYFRERVAGTASVAARVGPMSSFSAGIGLASKTVGGRAGFQAAW